MVSNLCRYFRDCYEADNRRTTVWDVFHESVDHRLDIGSREEVLTGDLPYAPIDAEEAEAARSEAQVYRSEKELLYMTWFLVGRVDPDEKEARTLCAPLLSFPASFVEEEDYLYVEPERDNRRINHLVLETLSDTYGPLPQAPATEGEVSLTERLADTLSGTRLETRDADATARLLDEIAPSIDTTSLRAYPDLVGLDELRSLRQEAKGGEDGVQLVPASVVALVERSIGTRGVLHELSATADAETHSTPLRLLLGDAEPADSFPAVSLGRVPAVLSRAQQHVLDRGARAPVSLVVGPPGTGKSYTIAALATEHLSRGESVLVASKMNHAVDVVGEKIQDQLGLDGVVMRAGRRGYMRGLKDYLERLLSGMVTKNVQGREGVDEQRRTVERLETQVNEIEDTLDGQFDNHRRWGRWLADPTGSIWSFVRKPWARWRLRWSSSLPEQALRLEMLRERRVAETVSLVRQQHLHRLDRMLQQERDELKMLLSALRARTSGTQAERFGKLDLDVLLQAFPVWLVNTTEVAEVLPFQAELFDLAIIDEASQCDIASSLPILQRAKRVVVCGDPKQLRHVSFLSTERQSHFRDEHEVPESKADLFDYRNRSLLDLADDRIDSQKQVTFLDEHYRSAPPIIQFSNDQFYDGALRIMTAKPDHDHSDALALQYCEGRREERGVNPSEIEVLTTDVAAQVRRERRRDESLRHTVGILSPLRAQVEAIQERIVERLAPMALEKHDVLVGTAHTFQGEERDVMYLSWGIDPDVHSQTLRFVERPDVFNVSVTRARYRKRIYASVEPDDLPHDSLLGQYLRYVSSASDSAARRQGKASSPTSAFAESVADTLREHGCQARVGYPLAGLTVDVVAASDDRRCGLDLIGSPGRFADSFPLERYRMLHRAGLPLLPISYARWSTDAEACLQPVLDVLAE